MKKYLVPLCLFLVLGVFTTVSAEEAVSQHIILESGWNIVSTPKVLSSHNFSAAETSENFDIYLLDASVPSGWSTMADLGQTEFTPLYGYFINNKTGSTQTLTFNYQTDLSPYEKIFTRAFDSEGWYSIGVANSEYAKAQGANTSDTNNPSNILSLLEGQHNLVIDFTDALYTVNRKSVGLSDPWKAVVPGQLNMLNDMRETKGYAIYIKEAGATYIGFQDEATTTTDVLVIKTSAEDPDAATLQVENDSTSDWFTVFAFDLDTETSAHDIHLNTAVVGMQTSFAPVEDVKNDIRLVIEGEQFTDFYLNTEGSTHTEVTFDLGGAFVIGAGDTVTAELQVEFKAADGVNYPVGETITATTTASGWEAEGVGGVTVTGSAVGDTHTLRSAGIVVENPTKSATVTTVDGNENDYATFTIEFDVTAFEDDIYISTDSATSIVYEIQDGSGNDLSGIGLSVATWDSSADENGTGTFFIVREGETEEFTIEVAYRPEVVAQAARLQLLAINFDIGEVGNSNQTWNAIPLSTYRTATKTIVN